MHAALLFAACRTHAPVAPDADQTFRQIQEHEAEIARASNAASNAASCAASGPLVESICSHADSVCELASSLQDKDAVLRCDAARDACFGARGRVDTSCATSAEP